MKTVTVATAGHIDHGKTALVRALTGIDTDRLPEEKRRGITIDLGFAHLDLTSDLRIAMVDVPGHEAFIRNMAAGASGVDLGLLVIAADEGIMPQTREHLAILDLLGVQPAVVALTKSDLVDPQWLELVRDDVHDTLRDSAFAAAPVIATSVVSGHGLTELRQALHAAALQHRQRDGSRPFRMPVDRVFTVRGTGTVVTGTVWTGSLRVEEQVWLLPSGRKARVKGLQEQNESVAGVCAGERAAIALAGVAHTEIDRGETLVTSVESQSTRMLTAYLQVLPDAPRPVRLRDRLHLHLGTAVVLARARPLESAIEPGTSGWAVLRLEDPLVARPGDRFILRSYSPVSTVAGGVVAEAATIPYRRRATELPLLEDLRSGDPVAQVKAAVRLAGWAGTPRSGLPTLTESGCTDASGLIEAAGVLYAPELLDRTAEALLQGLTQLHEQFPRRAGIELERFRQTSPPGATNALRAAAEARLVNDGKIVIQAGTVRLLHWTPRLDHHAAEQLQHIRERLQQTGLAAPSVSELGGGVEIHDLLRLLEADQQIVELTPELYMDRGAVLDATSRLRAHLADGKRVTPGELRDFFGLSRKNLIPLLEYLDRQGITRREGDLRTLAGVQAVLDLPRGST